MLTLGICLGFLAPTKRSGRKRRGSLGMTEGAHTARSGCATEGVNRLRFFSSNFLGGVSMVSFLRRPVAQFIFLIALTGCLGLSANAQTNSSSGNSASPESAANVFHVYDAAHEVSIEGTVVKVADLQTSDSLSGEYLTFSTAQGIVNAHLGAETILSKNHVTLKPGDKVSLAGAYVTGANGPVLLARLLRTGDQMVALRSSSGLPLRLRAATNGSSVMFSSPTGGSR